MAAPTSIAPKAIGVDDINIYDTACALCKNKQIHTEGIYHCKNCGVMCENCSTKHPKIPKKKGHWATRIRLIQKVAPSKPSFRFVSKCEVHNDKKIKGYCIDCGELFCKLCKKEKHTECAIRETIEVMSGHVNREKDIREAKMDLVDLNNRTKRLLKYRKNELKGVARKADAFMKRVKQTREKVNGLLDSMVTSISIEMEGVCKSEKELIETDVKRCEDILPIFKPSSEHLDAAFKGQRNSDVWITQKKVERLVTYYDEIITAGEQDITNLTFEFIPSNSLAEILKSSDELGSMKVISSRLGLREKVPEFMLEAAENTAKRKPHIVKDKNFENNTLKPWTTSTRIKSSVTPTLPAAVKKTSNLQRLVKSTTPSRNGPQHEISPSWPNQYSSRAKPETTKYKLEEEVAERPEPFGVFQQVKLEKHGIKEISLPTDRDKCCVTGCTYLPNGRLVVVDNHNQNVKLFTIDFQILAVFPLSDRPWDTTSCYSELIAISYPFATKIEMITIGVEMKIEGIITTDRKCHGVGFHKGEKWLYTACGEGLDAQLQAFSLDGILRKVIIPKHGVFNEPCFLSMTRDCSRVYISDLDNGIIGFDTTTGNLTCQYRDPNIKRYWDLTTDKDGRVFVVTTNPDGMYVMMGERNGHLVTELRGENKPCSLCYTPITNSLVVSRWQTENLEVFRIVST